LKANSMAFANRSTLAAAAPPRNAREDDRRILEASARYRPRLANFIRRRVPDPGDAEDILQEVFYELVAAYRLFEPVEEAGAWLFRVARNRITDFFRKKRPEALPEAIRGPFARRRTGIGLRARRAARRNRGRALRIACGSARRLRGTRIRRPQLQRTGCRSRRQRQRHGAAQAPCRALPAAQAASHSR